MAEIQLSASQTGLTLQSPITLVGTAVNYDTCKFSFGPEWDGYTKTAIFYSNTNSEPIAMLLDANGVCTIPWEPLSNPGLLYVGVFGVKDKIEIPTNFITVRVTQGSAGNNAPPPPSLDIYAQILKKVNDIQVGTGAEGKSAYQIAVDNGFVGTEDEWLASLKGEKGDTGAQGLEGPQGIQGPPGIPGATTADGVSITDAGDYFTSGNVEGSLQEVGAQLKDMTTLRQQSILNKAIQDSILSVAKSKSRYDDSDSSIFTENWSNLNAWTLGAAGSVQVSSNKLYGVSTNNGYAGAAHYYPIANNENLRAVFKVSIVAGATLDGIVIGVSTGTSGATPARYAADSFGIYFNHEHANVDQINLGAVSTAPQTCTLSAGDYIATVTVDSKYISVTAVKTDGSVEASCRKLRSGFNVNNIFIFNSDRRGTLGSFVEFGCARKELQTITPRTFGEGIVKTSQWTGDGTQSFRIFLPANYDSRIPAPLAICWHGHGSDETSWTINSNDTNYGKIQKALTDAGYMVLSCSLDSSKTTWGSVASTNAYFQAYKYVRNNYSIGDVVFFANSMGGIESLNALSENLIPCVAWAGTSPTFDLQKNYNNSMFTSVIKTSYGIASDGSDYASKTSGRDPALMNASSFRGIPVWIASAQDDTIVPKVDNGDKLASLVSGSSSEVVKVDVASGGHAFSITPYTSQIVNFFNKYVSEQ